MTESNKIVLKTRDLFLRFGFKSVTMNDISRHLGISKKTLYQYVENKDDLISRVVKSYILEETSDLQDIQRDGENAIDEMVRLSRHWNRMLQKTHPSAVYDLRKYYRSAWNIIEKFRKEYAHDMILKNIKRGVNEGLYRNDINPDVISKLYMGMSEVILNDSYFPFPEYNPGELHKDYIHYHIRGLATTEGLKVLEHYQQVQKDNS